MTTTTTKPSAELALDDAASTRFVRFFAERVASDGDAGETTTTTTTTGGRRRVVRFFDRKDFMSAHGDDATYIARTFYKVRTDERIENGCVRSGGADGRARRA
jgi:hypothetical protein